MKKGFYLILILLFSLFVVGCFSSQKISKSPLWIESVYDRSYPYDKYLIAIGSASTYENAVSSAYASLSQSFSVRVESTLYTFSESHYGQDFAYSSDSQIESGILSTEAETIIGAQVINSYLDSNNMYWVRIAIDRQKAAKLYQKEIEQLELQISEIQMGSLKENSTISKYFKLQKALPVAVKHQQLTQQLYVLKETRIPSLLRSVEKQLDDLAKTVKVSLKISDNTDEQDRKRIENSFIALLNDYGFLIKEGAVIVELTYTKNFSSLANSPYVHCNWTIEAKIKEKDQIISAFSKSGRTTALSEQDAEAKALKEALSHIIEGSSPSFDS
jgi:hypothetical protein